jgi:hypothetical protein
MNDRNDHHDPNDNTTANQTTNSSQHEQDAAAVLDAIAELYRCGAGGYRDQMLAAGRKAREYVQLHITQAGTQKVRAAAVLAIEERLTTVARSKVDTNRLMKASVAVELLAGDTDYSAMPYTVIRDAFVLLVSRDRRQAACQERWSVHPSTTLEQAQEVFKHIADNRLDRDTALALVKKLLDPDYQPKPKGQRGRPWKEQREEPQPQDDTTAGTVAEMAAELVCGSDAPDDSLQALLGLLSGSEQLSSKGKRAIQAALLVLSRRESPSPAQIAAAQEPPLNGHHHLTLI